ncbi:murein hydrolase activator EnvC [uncultured Selenomonas sp.]|uniref:murein hydrolase activator EnvC family protein n=1 Tax=uncultured Selenomonas sp. TaxID=159275 RepID=UPI0025CD13D8|nr:M23 family metallopeptidase [uncultured Selenomonas sp.]
MKKIKVVAFALALALTAAPFQTFAASLEDEQKSYEEQAQQKKAKSDEIQNQINNFSEVKRQLDEEADKAIAEHKECKAALDETEGRMKENEARLEVLGKDYEKKSDRLGKRVRDIYMHGQISYLDVLFGAKDFGDLMTRMDLLKRVIHEDYDLVQTVLNEKQEIETRQASLEKDRKTQAEQEQKTRAARQIMEQKVAKQQALIDKMKSDKAVFDQQYDELMAASKQIANMIRASRYHVEAPAGGGGGGSGAMVWPISGPITSEFGWRTHPITGDQRFHSGLDIGGDYGVPVCAAQAGTVTYAGWISGYGNTVIIDHGGGVTTLYGHNQSLAVGEGQSVAQGQVISYCGSTGNSTGPHCHFEVRQNGEPVSPYGYL